MELMCENVYRIPVPLPTSPLKTVNAYLVKGAPRNLLIDTGFSAPASRAAMAEGLAEIGVRMEDTDIFLTHFHLDHVQLAPHIATESTRVFMGENDLRYVLKYLPTPKEARMAQMLASGFSPAEAEKWSSLLAEDRYNTNSLYTGVPEGHVFNVGGYALACVATPGHTPGHTCLYDAAHELLFCGDHILYDISPNITDWQGEADPLGDYMGSLKKISRLSIQTALCGHRRSLAGPQARIAQLLRHHARRLDEALQCLHGTQPVSAYQVAAKLTWAVAAKGWDKVPLGQKFFAVGETTAHLDHLVALGKAQRGQTGGVRTYTRA